MDQGLTVQQTMALEQKYRAMAVAENTSNALDGKLTTLLGSGGLVMAATGWVYANSSIAPGYQTLVQGLALVALLCLMLLVILVLDMWRPMKFPSLGSHDWDVIHGTIINIPPAEAYCQVLSECVGVIRGTQAVNEQKSTVVHLGARLVTLQTVVATLAIVLSFTASAAP